MKTVIKREKDPVSYDIRADGKIYGRLTDAGSPGTFNFFASGAVPIEVLRDVLKFIDENGLL